ncbi:MAG TPA: RAMP superfamily CRISPR-associated protein [Dehalococcoidia bacterium]|jgi:CRISPR/Cas system CSM-associated protein Csm3 (group 7 of RAMP superfamily)|nr:RAMP superfamily CRISPR-associated protein [Dehalococcoidia bacterium]
MHKARYNLLHLCLELSPRGPLLVKAGGISADPSLPDMQFVRTFHPEQGETLYIPGSSLKGVVRSFVEKVLRTLDDSRSWRHACPTFADDPASCARRLGKEELPSYEIYRHSCGACRIFGHTRLRGRASFTDFLPRGEVRTEVRYGVAVSRLSHAVAQGPFEMEVAVAGTFAGKLVLENFELWQLALLALALESIERGLLKVGYGKNRGFGEVSISVREARLDEVATALDPTVWRGLGALVNGDEAARYGLSRDDCVGGLPQPSDSVQLGIYTRRYYDAQRWGQIVPRLLATIGATQEATG